MAESFHHRRGNVGVVMDDFPFSTIPLIDVRDTNLTFELLSG
jgi:hypothetical protein